MKKLIKKKCPRCNGTGVIEEIEYSRIEEFKSSPWFIYKGKKCRLGIEFAHNNTCQIYFEDTNKVEIVDRELVKEMK